MVVRMNVLGRKLIIFSVQSVFQTEDGVIIKTHGNEATFTKGARLIETFPEESLFYKG